jgi:imidazolonepropionase-like amidohydrolase
MARSLIAAFLLINPAWLGAQDSRVVPWVPLDSATTAIVGVNVVPMDRNTVLADHTVLVRDGRIFHVGPRSSSVIPGNARRVDGRNKWLIPGLVDAHVHLAYVLNAKHNPLLLRLFVAEGVTTVVNLSGLPEHVELRSKVAHGEVFGPTIFTSGFYLGEPWTKAATNVDSAIRQQRAAGFDLIKLHGNASGESYRTMAAAARRDSIPLVGHLPRNLGLTTALNAGQTMIAHAEEYLYGWFGHRTLTSREQVIALVDTAAALTKRAGTWVTPTLFVFGAIPAQREKLDSVLNTPDMKRIPDVLKYEWAPERNQYRGIPLANLRGFRDQYALLKRITRALHAVGVPLLMGTDAMATAAVLPGTSAHQELRALVDAGLSPFEALKTATVNAATFFRQPGEFGVIRPGARADLVMLDANPLQQIDATSRISGVMLRGRWLNAAARDSLRNVATP